MAKTKVMAIVQGGCLQHVYSERSGIDFVVIDVDNLREEKRTGQEIDQIIASEKAGLVEVAIGGSL